ncbi:MAG: MBL fold metallo-hydrolase [Deltaproteobacteria bacterium]|nr:MBL fold metallo-hydrolase [Deltaproteobacteria bacterium]
MRFSVLASGSSGNTCYVETDEARVLIDAGLSCRETVKRLELIGVDPRELDALILTHEHQDHIKGAGPIVRRFDIPLYLNPATLRRGMKTLGKVSRPVPVNTGQTISVKDLFIETFTKCHDAADPMGIVFSSNGIRVGIVTDMGRSTRLVEDRLRGCQALIIEFNHDQDMLEQGPYPLDLKRRIKGRDGHLSNLQAGDLLRALCHADLRAVILAHLSKENNEVQRAVEVAEKVLLQRGQHHTDIMVSSQDIPLPLVTLE